MCRRCPSSAVPPVVAGPLSKNPEPARPRLKRWRGACTQSTSPSTVGSPRKAATMGTSSSSQIIGPLLGHCVLAIESPSLVNLGKQKEFDAGSATPADGGATATPNRSPAVSATTRRRPSRRPTAEPFSRLPRLSRDLVLGFETPVVDRGRSTRDVISLARELASLEPTFAAWCGSRRRVRCRDRGGE